MADEVSIWWKTFFLEKIQVSKLKGWTEIELIPPAVLAFDGEGDYMAGDHCQFCKAGGACAANGVKHLAIEERNTTPAHLLSPEAVAVILFKCPQLVAYLIRVFSMFLLKNTI
jgi:hypothetical protein